MVAAAVESKHIIHTFIDQAKINVPEQLSADDIDFWISQGFSSENIPSKIILATASTRKLIMAYCLLNGFIFPNQVEQLVDQYGNGPLGLQKLFSDKVHNGDGSYKEGEILVGIFHGLPVYGRSTDGETPGNNALEEARNKANHAYETVYKGQKVIVIAGDAVDKVDLSGNEVFLGKPMNMKNFPIRSDFEVESEYQTSVEQFMKSYLQILFQQFQEIQHISALVAVNGLTGEIKELETFLSTTIPSVGELQNVTLDVGAGGGAGFQQFFDFEQYGYLSDEDKIKWIWIVYCTIAGMPVFSMLGLATEFGKKVQVRKRELSVDYPKTEPASVA